MHAPHFRSPLYIYALHAIVQVRVALTATHCRFPGCTLAKLQCSASENCTTCLAALQAGDSATAVEQCRSGNSATLLDSVVSACAAATPQVSQFWQARCAQDSACAACFDAMAILSDSPSDMSQQNWDTVVAAGGTPGCAAARGNPKSLSWVQTTVFNLPSPTSACVKVTAACVSASHVCTGCLNGSIDSGAEVCQALLNFSGFAISASCECPSQVAVLARVNFAIVVVGYLSASTTLLVLVLMYAHGHHRTSVQSRLLFGLFTVNFIFSVGNMLGGQVTDDPYGACDRAVVHSRALTGTSRIAWYAGKFGAVAYEIAMLGLSTWTLYFGVRRVPIWAEVAVHALCAGVTATAGFAFGKTLSEIFSNPKIDLDLTVNWHSYLSADDDHDDDSPWTSWGPTGVALRRYWALIADMFVAYDCFLAVMSPRHACFCEFLGTRHADCRRTKPRIADCVGLLAVFPGGSLASASGGVATRRRASPGRAIR